MEEPADAEERVIGARRAAAPQAPKRVETFCCGHLALELNRLVEQLQVTVDQRAALRPRPARPRSAVTPLGAVEGQDEDQEARRAPPARRAKDSAGSPPDTESDRREDERRGGFGPVRTKNIRGRDVASTKAKSFWLT